MIITVIIENQSFEIDCDTGTQDIAWLSLCASSLYGQSTYPIQHIFQSWQKTNMEQYYLQN